MAHISCEISDEMFNKAGEHIGISKEFRKELGKLIDKALRVYFI